MKQKALSLAVPLIALGCTHPSEPPGPELETIVQRLCLPGKPCEETHYCRSDGCGMNAASVDDILFEEVHNGSPALPNAAGFRLGRARRCPKDLLEQPGGPERACPGRDASVELVVRRDRLYTRGHGSDTEEETAGDLLVELEHHSGAVYELYFRQAVAVPYWTQGKAAGETVAYDVLYRKSRASAGGGRLPVEADFVSQRSVCARSGGTGLVDETVAAVFTGDRYDTVAKTVSDTGRESGWFNLACRGTAAWKMQRLRHTAAAALEIEGTTVCKTRAQRQAMLKMLTADYCGTGRSFTRNGQPLRYEDADGWYRESPALDVADPVDAAAVEAIWTGDGALCLANPRLAAEEPLTAEEVARECERAGRPRPPRCTADDLLSWRARGHVLSAHPRPVRPRPESPGTPRPPVAR